jgi:MerR family mercuric resistance operon transcriptional regulator
MAINMKYLKISELAQTADTSTHTVRNYVQERLLCCVEHTPSGYGLYDEVAVERLRFIRAARNAGLMIADIKPLIYALDKSEQSSSKNKAEQLKGKVKRLMQQLALFNGLLEDIV